MSSSTQLSSGLRAPAAWWPEQRQPVREIEVGHREIQLSAKTMTGDPVEPCKVTPDLRAFWPLNQRLAIQVRSPDEQPDSVKAAK